MGCTLTDKYTPFAPAPSGCQAWRMSITLALIPTLVMVAGILLWALMTGKPSKAGEIMFQIGLFWLVYTLLGVKWP